MPQFGSATSQKGLHSVRQRRARVAGAARHATEALERRLLLAGGDPDPAFGTDGLWMLDSSGGAEQVVDLALAADGKIVALIDDGGGDVVLLRLGTDGTPDGAFGDAGRVQTDLAARLGRPAGAPDRAKALLVEPDGTIVVAGATSAVSGSASSTDAFVLRYTAEGAVDASFGNNGVVVTDFGSTYDSFDGLALGPGSTMLAAGQGSFQTQVVRYTAVGAPDPSFGTGGKTAFRAALYGSGAHAVTVQADGKVLVGGYAYTQSSVINPSVTRLSANGALDATWGTGGTLTVPGYGELFALAVAPDGKVVGAGVGSYDGSIIQRYTPTGKLDLAFDGDGVTFAANLDLTRDVAIAADGRILVAGRGPHNEMAVARFQADGFPDPTFGAQGLSLIGPIVNRVQYSIAATSIAVQPDGQVLVAGAVGNVGTKDVAVARVDGWAPANLPPEADAGGPYVVGEGGHVMLDARGSTDADGRISTYEWDFNFDGSRFDVDGSGSTPSFFAVGIDGPASRTVAVRVTDSMGAVAVRTATVSIVNAAPTLLLGGPGTVPAGTPYTLTLAASDPGADTITSWRIDWGDGTSQAVPGATTSVSHLFPSSTTAYRVTATATDEDGTYAANNGALDPTFGNGGIAVPPRSGYFTPLQAVPDPLTGKTYVMTDHPFEIARFNTDGTQDMTWGIGGLSEYGGNQYIQTAGAIAVQADGKVLMAMTDTYDTVYLARYTPLGKLDRSFGTGGYGYVSAWLNDHNTHSYMQDIAVQPDGKIVVAGGDSYSGISSILVRFNPDGTLDPSFGSGGKARPLGYVYGGISKVQPLPEGKYLVNFAGDNSTDGLHLARLNADGSVDITFGVNGQYRATGWWVTDFAVLPDGKILAAGSSLPGGWVSGQAFVRRLNADGQIDPTFGDAGTCVFDPSPGYDYLKRLALDADGNILALLAFGQGPIGGNGKVGIVRVTPDGQVDRRFADGGIVVPYAATNGAPISDMYVSAGKLVVLGRSSLFAGQPAGYSMMRLNIGPLTVRENDAPVVTAPLARTIDEGGSVTLTIPFADPDTDDGHLLSIDWGDGWTETVFVPPGTFTHQATHKYIDDAPNGTPQDVYTVTVRVDDGAVVATGTTPVTVRNVAPMVDLGPDQQGNEGARFSFDPTLVVTDPGAPADVLTYTWRVFNAGGALLASASGTSWSYTPTDNGTFRVELTVADDDGGVGVDTATIVAANVAPIVSLTTGGYTEGQTINLNPTVSDQGSADTLGYSWNVTSSNGQVVPGATTKNLSFVALDNGQYTLTFTVTDDDGGSTTWNRVITVSNVIPQVTIMAQAIILANQTFAPTITTTDPGTDTISSWLIKWGDGITQTVSSVGGIGHTYAPGAWTFSATPTDEDGTYAAVTRAVSVYPVPTLTSGVLRITGTAGSDTIAVTRNGGAYDVTFGTAPGALVQSYPTASVASVVLDGLAGDDKLTLSGTQLPAATLLGGDGNDTLTAGGGGSDPITLLGGAGGDAISLLPTSTRSWTVDGEAGTDFFTLTGTSAADTLEVQGGQFLLNGFAPVVPLNTEVRTVQGSGGDDVITVAETEAGKTLYVIGQDGADTLRLGKGTAYTAWTGTIVFDGGLGADGLFVNDQANVAVYRYTLTDSTLTRTNSSSVSLYGLESVTVNGGTGMDAFDLTASANTAFTLNGGSPVASAPGDRLGVTSLGTSSTFTRGPGPDAGRYSSATRKDVTFTGIEMLGAGDNTPPAVTATAFKYAGNRQELEVRFSEDVQWTLSATDLVVRDLATGAALPASAFAFTFTGGLGLPGTGTWTATTPLPDGNYQASIPAGAVTDDYGNPLPASSFDFFVLAGDANRDRVVNFNDLVVLAQNYNTTGKTFADGDFNYDGGRVDFNDLVLLAQRYNTSLPGIGGGAASAAAGLSVTFAQAWAVATGAPAAVATAALPRPATPPVRPLPKPVSKPAIAAKPGTLVPVTKLAKATPMKALPATKGAVAGPLVPPAVFSRKGIAPVVNPRSELLM